MLVMCGRNIALYGCELLAPVCPYRSIMDLQESDLNMKVLNASDVWL